jgi:hypothetical protein
MMHIYHVSGSSDHALRTKILSYFRDSLNVENNTFWFKKKNEIQKKKKKNTVTVFRQTTRGHQIPLWMVVLWMVVSHHVVAGI